jgi:hypothetical protein
MRIARWLIEPPHALAFDGLIYDGLHAAIMRGSGDQSSKQRERKQHGTDAEDSFTRQVAHFVLGDGKKQ